MVKRIATAAVCVLAAASMSYAGSVDTYGIGSRATALGGAYSATADDPFAAYYNPAGLSQIEGKIFSVGAHAIVPTIKMSGFTVDGNKKIQDKSFELESNTLVAPHLGYAQKINDTFALGVAVYAPWGLELDWEKNPTKNPGSYSSYHSYYKRYGVTPTLSYKFNDKLAFGVGVTLGKSEAGADTTKFISDNMRKTAVDLVIKASAISQIEKSQLGSFDTTAMAEMVYRDAYAKTGDSKYLAASEMMKKLNDSSAGLKTISDIESKIPDSPAIDNNIPIGMELEDDFNYSYNLGLMYKPVDTVTVGLTYRSEAKADFKGDVFKNSVKETTATMNYNHPQQVQAGVRYQPHDKFSIECDVVWTDWSINQNQVSKLAKPIKVTLLPGFTTEKGVESFHREWEDTKQLRFGMEYIVNDFVTLRGGYFYDPTPIPDNTLDMQWPDADKKVYTLGAGLNFGRYTVDTVLQYTDIEKARIIGGESKNLNHSFQGNKVSASADGHIVGVGVTLTARF